MMAKKVRSFAPLPDYLLLEDLVPEDNFYRRLEATLDLSFVRELVAPLYAKGGRPSVDPVVFFKLQLVMFFEGLPSERQLMGAVADRLSLGGTSATTSTSLCPTIPRSPASASATAFSPSAASSRG
jgi:transposase